MLHDKGRRLIDTGGLSEWSLIIRIILWVDEP
jgi:hypothetical protein